MQCSVWLRWTTRPNSAHHLDQIMKLSSLLLLWQHPASTWIQTTLGVILEQAIGHLWQFGCLLYTSLWFFTLRDKECTYRVAKSSQLSVKITAYFVSIGWLLCLAFLYGWCFLNKISLDWQLTLTTQPSTSKLSDNPAHHFQDLLKVRNFWRYFQGVVTFRDHNFWGFRTMETLW